VTAAGRARLDQHAWGVPYVLAMSVAAFVVSYGLYVAVRPGDGLAHSDVPHYNAYAVHVAARQLPYRDFQLEYPPAAVVAFVLPAADLPGIASTDGAAWDPPNAAARRYHDRFVLLVLVLGIVMVASTVFSLAALHRSPPVTLMSVGVLVSSPWLLGDVFPERFDVWPAALTAVAVALALRNRYASAACMLAVAAAAKLYALVLLPVVLIVVMGQRGARSALTTAGVALATLVVLVAPFAIVSPSGVWDALRVQFRGGLHIETAASAVLVLASRASAELSSLGLFEPFTLSDREAEHGLGRGVLVGPGTGAAVTILNALLVAGVLGLLASLARSKGDVRERLVRYSAAVVATTVALGSVLSPQYLVWLLPLVVLVGGRRGTAATLLFVLASVLTQVWFRWIYTSYAQDLDAGTATVLLARNLLLLAIALVLALPAKSLLTRSNRP
jgi:hypothetical protein